MSTTRGVGSTRASALIDLGGKLDAAAEWIVDELGPALEEGADADSIAFTLTMMIAALHGVEISTCRQGPLQITLDESGDKVVAEILLAVPA